ncbi:hypothetical protein GGI43DRAFT_408892 [Trichoderma evansii]
MGTCMGAATGIGQIKASTPPPSRTSTMVPLQQPIRHSCASSPSDATASINSVSILSFSPLTTAFAYLHLLLVTATRSKSPEHHRQEFFSFLHRHSPRLTAEEGLPTLSCKPPTRC